MGTTRAARVAVRRLRLFLIAAAAATLGVPAALAGSDAPFRINVDLDPEEELVVPQAVGQNGNPRRRLVLVDLCDYRQRSYQLTGVWDNVNALSSVEVDGRRRQRELLFAMSNGPAGLVGLVKIVRLDKPARPRNACPIPNTMFSYSIARPPKRPPAGQVVGNVQVEVKELSRRYPGKEVRLTEMWAPRGRLNRPSNWHYTFFRLQAGKYVAYGTHDIKAR